MKSILLEPFNLSQKRTKHERACIIQMYPKFNTHPKPFTFLHYISTYTDLHDTNSYHMFQATFRE